jgi:hypothetical protein
MLPKPLASAVIVVVTLIWCANFVLQFFVVTYHPDVTINGVFMTLVGGAFALSRKETKDKDSQHSSDDGKQS